MGAGSKLRLVFDAANNGSENGNSIGIYLTYGYSSNIQMGPTSAGVLAYSNNMSWKYGTDKNIKVNIDYNSQLTLILDTIVIFNKIQLPAGYINADKSSWKHLFSAFTGGDALRFAVSDINIQYYKQEFVYGISSTDSTDVPTSWQASPTFNNFSTLGSHSLWIASINNPDVCHKFLGIYSVGYSITNAASTAATNCNSADGSLLFEGNFLAGTAMVYFKKDGLLDSISTAISANQFELTGLLPGLYDSIRIHNGNNCFSNFADPIMVTQNNVLANIAQNNATAMAYQLSNTGLLYDNNYCEWIAAINSTNNSLGYVTAKVFVTGNVILQDNEVYVGRYYDLEATHNNGANVTLYFTDAEINQYNSFALAYSYGTLPLIGANGENLKIKAYHSNALGNGPQGYDTVGSEFLIPTSVIHHTTDGIWEVTFSTPSFSGFFATTLVTGTVLSAQDVSLNAQNLATVNHLNWQDMGSSKVATYTVERSTDGKNFTKIESVSAELNKDVYYYIDKNPIKGLNFYRLSIVQKTGILSYSKVVSAEVKNKAVEIQVHPNPVMDELTVTLIGNLEHKMAHLLLIDALGHVVENKTIDGGGIYKFNMQALASGFYMLKYQDEEGVALYKLNKQ
jgi:hypothetical protein